MAFDFINSLSESKLLPTTHSVEKYRPQDLPDFLFLNLCALRVLLLYKSSNGFAREYVRKTRQWGNFELWRNVGTDLYQLLHLLRGRMSTHLHDRTALHLDYALVTSWLRDARHNESREVLTRRLFVRLDRDLGIRDESLKAIRRLVMNWPTIDEHQRALALTRMLQIFRSRMPRAELYGPLAELAHSHALVLKGVDNPETLDGVREGATAAAAQPVAENATTGATSAASVATVPGGLGTGFDPKGDHGVYEKPRKRKPVVLRR